MRTSTFVAAVLLAACVLSSCESRSSPPASGGEYFVYVGTDTRSNASKGVYGFRFNTSTGTLTSLGLMAETPSPRFMAVHPNGRFLYAANEREASDAAGNEVMGNKVSAFSIDPQNGRLTLLKRTASGGNGPAHVVADPTGKFLIVSNYRGGSVAVLPIQADGTLGDATSVDRHSGRGPNARQEGPHAHGSAISPDNRHVLVGEHGIDKVMIYNFDAAKGMLLPATPPSVATPPGYAPRHVAFHPNGKTAYVVNELSSKLMVFAFSSADATLRQLQDIRTTPPEFSGDNSLAEVLVDKAGQFLYVSNRGHDSVAVYAIDPSEGTVSLVEHVPTGGKTPWDISLDPTESFLFAGNRASNNLTVFRRDATTGRLTSTGQALEVPEPTCVVFAPVQ
jgi:6-phosphogluconolactonase